MKEKIIRLIVIVILIGIVIYLYASKIGTHGIKVNEIKVTNSIINTFHGLKIVQISDIYYGNTTTIDDLTDLEEKVNLTKPDIIVFTGNIFTDKVPTDDDFNKIADIINGMTSTYGKYIVSGKNDVNNDYFTKLIDSCKLVLLDDTYDTIYNKNNENIIIAGMQYKDTNSDYQKISDAINNISNATTDYKILITNYADNISGINYGTFNMILAGNTLGGIVNLPLIKNMFLKNNVYKDSIYNLGNTTLYISSGIGTDTIPLRLFNRPSINFYRIVKQ
jgi:predicted MPP superfamily phosphohydrolase